MTLIRPRHFIASLLLPALPAAAGDAKQALPAVSTSGGDWQFSLSAGPAYRHLGDVRITGGYRSAGSVLPSLVGGSSLVTPPIGAPGVIGDRTYNDGFVGQDAGTPGDGSTWNWGYDNPGQIQGDQLVFSATGFQSAFSEVGNAPPGGPSRTRDLEGAVPHLQFDAHSPLRLGPFRVGFSAGMNFMKIGSSLAFSNFSLNQTRQDFRLDYVDRYDLNGLIPPSAPYQGSAAGPGPLIPNRPATRDISTVSIGSSTGLYSNSVSSSFDLSALSVTLGPSLSLERGRFVCALSAGLSLHLYDWQARQDETLSATTTGGTAAFAGWSDRDGGVRLRPGLYLQGEAGYQLTEGISLLGFVRLDVAEGFTVSSGPTSYKLDPGGTTAGVLLRFALP
jgi:hypothetical protein